MSPRGRRRCDRDYLNATSFDLFGFRRLVEQPVSGGPIYYVVFVGINFIGIEIAHPLHRRSSPSRARVLAFFFVAVLISRSIHSSWVTNIPPTAATAFLPTESPGIFPALPFAIWFYLAIEELPLAAEESHDPKRDIPRATIWGLTHADGRRRPDPVPQHRSRSGAEEIGASASRCSTDSRRCSARAQRLPARAGRAHRLDRQLLHDHLRLRAQHLLALARRLFPAEPVDHPRQPNTPYVALIGGRRDRLHRSRWSSTRRQRHRLAARSSARCCTWPCSAR